MRDFRKCKCQKCGYEWEPRKKAPKSCPECKTRNWYKSPTKDEVNELIGLLKGDIPTCDGDYNESLSVSIAHHVDKLRTMGVSIADIKNLLGEEDE